MPIQKPSRTSRPIPEDKEFSSAPNRSVVSVFPIEKLYWARMKDGEGREDFRLAFQAGDGVFTVMVENAKPLEIRVAADWFKTGLLKFIKLFARPKDSSNTVIPTMPSKMHEEKNAGATT